MEILLIAWAFGWLVQNAVIETKHAVAGTTSPRSQIKLEKLRQQGLPGWTPRLGSGDWVRALIADMIEAKIAKRRALQAKRDRDAIEAELDASTRQAVDMVAEPPPQPAPEPEPAPAAEPEPPATDSPDPDDNTAGPDARVIPMFPTPPDTDQQEATPAMTEVTGLDPAIAYAEETAAAHAAHSTAGAESYFLGLADAGVAGETLNMVAAAQAASAGAAELWTKAAEMLSAQKTVQQSYDQVPDAGDKKFLIGGR